MNDFDHDRFKLNIDPIEFNLFSSLMDLEVFGTLVGESTRVEDILSVMDIDNYLNKIPLGTENTDL